MRKWNGWQCVALCYASIALHASPALAQNWGDSSDSRRVGRAGTTTVSGDSGSAIFINPAAMIRRSQPRLLLSTQLRDSDLQYTNTILSESPNIQNQAPATLTPTVAYHHGNQDGTWVLGVLLRSGEQSIAFDSPSFGQPAEDVQILFPHRYGGTHYNRSWRSIALGGAIRVGDSLGLGISVGATQVNLRESRRIWAGFDGRDPILNPARDLELGFEATDSFAPSASLGIFLAPPNLPLEFALSSQFQRGDRLRGTPSLVATTATPFPAPILVSPEALLDRSHSIAVHAGARYLGNKSSIEIGADIYQLLGAEARKWSITGVSLEDDSSVSAKLESLSPLVQMQSYMALRAAYDYEVIPGYLWLSAGYSWTSPPVSKRDLTPTNSKLGGHTIGLGLEAYYENISISAGYGRTLARQQTLSPTTTRSAVINPFEAGTGPVGDGTYQTSSDTLGFQIEVAW